MGQVLIVIGGFLTSVTVACAIHFIKGNSNKDKIEIMNVRSRVRKIEKMNKESKQSLF